MVSLLRVLDCRADARTFFVPFTAGDTSSAIGSDVLVK